MENIIIGLQTVTQLPNIIASVLGTLLGIIIGAIPGLTATMGVALLVPITFVLNPVTGLIMLSGIYCGAIYGGSISAVLLRVPGTPASICTMRDGYILTQNGRAKEALGITVFASFIGGFFSAVSLLFFSPILAEVALKFGPFEYFALCVFGMSVVASISINDPLKGLMTGILGLLIGTVGMDPATGFPRYYFGVIELYSGFELVPVLIGLFALPEAFRLIISDKPGGNIETSFELKGRLLPPVGELFKKWVLFLKSTLIGIIIGIIPAIGPVVAPFVSYNEAMRSSKEPEKFGKGNIDGLIAAEAAKSGVTGASLIPLITLGIPGSAVAAVFLGGLTIHGLRPGPMLFSRSPDVVYGLFLGFFVVNFFMLVIGLMGSGHFAKVVKVPKGVIAPLVILFSVLGSFAVRNTFFDVWIVLSFGVLGYIFDELGLPPGPLVLGLVLGPLLEDNLMRSLVLAKGSFLPFITRPITVLFFVLSFISIGYAIVSFKKSTKTLT